MDRERVRIDSGLYARLGFWLAIVLVVLGYGTSSVGWNGIVIWTLLLLLGVTESIGVWRSPAISWLSSGLGAWLVVAPFVFGFAAAQLLSWNTIIVGLLVMFLSWRSATATQ